MPTTVKPIIPSNSGYADFIPNVPAKPVAAVDMTRTASIPMDGAVPVLRKAPGLQADPAAYERMARTGVTLQQQQPAFTPATNAPAAPAAAENRFMRASDSLKRVVNSVKKDPVGAVNTGLGIAGMMMYAGAKKPDQLQAPEMVRSTRPVYDYEDDRNRAYASNATATSTAQQGLQRQAGSDTSSYIAGMQNLQGQQMTAGAGIDQKIMELRREDARNDAATKSQDDRYNFETQRSFKEAQYNENVGAYNMVRDKGEKMVQGSMEYWNSKGHEDRQYSENVKTQQGNMAKVAFEDELRNLSAKYDLSTPQGAQDYQAERAAIHQRYGFTPGQVTLTRPK